MSHRTPLSDYIKARKAIASGLTLSVAVGVTLSSDERKDEATAPHDDHTHQEEVPDLNPVGYASIEVPSTASAYMISP